MREIDVQLLLLLHTLVDTPPVIISLCIASNVYSSGRNVSRNNSDPRQRLDCNRVAVTVEKPVEVQPLAQRGGGDDWARKGPKRWE